MTNSTSSHRFMVPCVRERLNFDRTRVRQMEYEVLVSTGTRDCREVIDHEPQTALVINATVRVC